MSKIELEQRGEHVRAWNFFELYSITVRSSGGWAPLAFLIEDHRYYQYLEFSVTFYFFPNGVAYRY